jgi:UDPglucose--hexose-1-phosphate uridylyltransferase
MSENQIRQNIATKEWIIYSPERGKRPKDYSNNIDKKNLPEHDRNCPFCLGNESELGEIIMSLSAKDKNEWQTRVIPNKFPALVAIGNTERTIKESMYLTMQGFGRHEVIIETPYHNRDMAMMSEEDLRIIVETYHRRYVEVMKTHENMIPIIFRNHGPRAGTSIIHPHSQLIVTGFIPNHIRKREIEAQHYHDEWGRCVYCEIIEHELKEETRIVDDREHVTSFVPFAAEVPFEIWIIPKKHQADFGMINNKEKDELSRIIITILTQFDKKLDNPDYNLIINSAPRYEADEPHIHWYLQIRPRLTTQAGFEIGSGIAINPSIPEEDAQYLRD